MSHVGEEAVRPDRGPTLAEHIDAGGVLGRDWREDYVVTDNPAPKPPLGAIPKWVWLEHRCTELSRALHERTANDRRMAGGDLDIAIAWAGELKEHLEALWQMTSSNPK